MMYDRNGLQLSPADNTLNSYRNTSVDLKRGVYNAYARAAYRGKNVWSMYTIGKFKDPRDAAFVAQEFEQTHDKEFVRQMTTDGLWAEYAKEFAEKIDIPVWSFPAEGLLIEDIKNDYGYKQNYVSDAKAALVEALKVFGVTPPALKEVPSFIKKVEKYYEMGLSYREAAKKVIGA